MKKNITTITFDLYNIMAVAMLGALGYALWSLRGFVLMLVVALVISTFIEDFVTRMEKLKIPRIISVLLFYAVAFTLFFGVLIFLVPIIIKEVGSLINLYPEISQFVNFDYLSGQFSQVTSFSGTIEQIKNTSAGSFFSSLGAFFGGFINLIIVFVISFYLSIQNHGIDRVLCIFAQKKYESSILRVWHNTQKKIGGWFRGQLIIALLLFIITYIGLSIIAVPYALLLSLLAGLFGLVPYGIVLALLPAVGMAFINGGLRMGVIVLIFYVLVQQLLDYVVQPLIFKRMTGIPSLLVVLSVIIGAKLFGIAGLIIAIPVALFGLEIIAEIERHKSKITE